MERIGHMTRLFHGEYVFVLEEGARLTSGRRYGTRIKAYFRTSRP